MINYNTDCSISHNLDGLDPLANLTNQYGDYLQGLSTYEKGLLLTQLTFWQSDLYLPELEDQLGLNNTCNVDKFIQCLNNIDNKDLLIFARVLINQIIVEKAQEKL